MVLTYQSPKNSVTFIGLISMVPILQSEITTQIEEALRIRTLQR
jgi:hypothetical protein